VSGASGSGQQPPPGGDHAGRGAAAGDAVRARIDWPAMVQDLRFPSIDGLRAFEAAARLGSFERAADELDLGASAIGKRIATLEDLLGTALFVRGARALQLTAAGREYLEQVRQALALLASMPQHRRVAQRRRRLRVIAPPTFARQILVPRLGAGQAPLADVELELQLSVPFAATPTPAADVEVDYGEADAASPDVLLREGVLPLAAPGLVRRLRPIQRAADLAGMPLLRTPLQPWRPWFEAAGLDWPEPDDGAKLLDLGLTLEAAVGGQGVALARPSLAAPWLQVHALVPVLRLQAPPWRHYRLQVHERSADALRFADWLRAQCDEAVRQGAEGLSGQA